MTRCFSGDDRQISHVPFQLASGHHVQAACPLSDSLFNLLLSVVCSCPQAIAKRGNYGSFLMDDLPLVRSIVSTLSAASSVPVACKIRMFPSVEDTIAYARMLEEAGCQLLAVHGRTRDQKSARLTADWHVIKAVREAVSWRGAFPLQLEAESFLFGRVCKFKDRLPCGSF